MEMSRRRWLAGLAGLISAIWAGRELTVGEDRVVGGVAGGEVVDPGVDFLHVQAGEVVTLHENQVAQYERVEIDGTLEVDGTIRIK